MIIGLINPEKVAKSVSKFFPEWVADILEADEKYVPLTVASKYAIMERIDGNIRAAYVPFVFGEKTIDEVLKVGFECQQCGTCCKNKKDVCEELDESNEKTQCTIYRKSNYPLACYTYPFMIDESARRGYGFMTIPEASHREAGRVEFGLLDGVLTLEMYPTEKHWTGSKPLKKMYKDVLLRLTELTEYDEIYPHLFSLGEIIGIPAHKMKQEEIDSSIAAYRQKLITKKNFLLNEITKI